MASSCSGVSRAAKRYISVRQLQKLSCASPRYSVRPREGALEGMRMQVGHAGDHRAGGTRQSPAAVRSGCTCVSRPASSHCSSTLLAQPAGSSASAANSAMRHALAFTRCALAAPRAQRPLAEPVGQLGRVLHVPQHEVGGPAARARHACPAGPARAPHAR